MTRARNGEPRKAALGFRAHSGWAVMVAVGGEACAPVVLDRRRVELVNREIPGSLQPYHAAAEMKLTDAEAFLRRCSDAVNAMARAAMRDALAELAECGYQVIGCAVLLAAGRPLADLASTLASHPAIHTAEGEFFRNALKLAAGSHGLAVTGIKERELFSRGAARLHIPVDELQRRAADLGKAIGPPWRQDEKLSCVAGWLVLGSP